jgi:tripartite-type tricarboxylate transporter receptor subunit TctC
MKTILKALAALLALATPAAAQNYPTKAVTMVIPFSPGASNDILGRALADQLSRQWGKPVVVENMPGAGGAIGMASVAKARPDGYRLIFSSSSFVTTAVTQKNLPFDPQKSIQPIARVADGQLIVVSGSRVPMKTLEDIKREAQAQKIFFGSTGPASLPTFLANLVADTLGVHLQGVNFKGGTEALLDLIGGRVDLYVGTVTTVIPAIKDGTATAVAVLGEKRAPVLPDVPTVAEAGYPAAQAAIWWGVMGPAGMPAELVQKINADIKTAAESPAVSELITKQDAFVSTMPAADFDRFVNDEFTKWRGLAERFKMIEN